MFLYVDMDGVLTDFDRQLSDILGYPTKGTETSGKNSAKVWKKIEDAGVKYWSEMPWMPEGRRLWDHIKKYGPTILTAPARHEDCKVGKRKWIQDNIPGTPYIMETKKYLYADPNSILIDDREKNINAWEKAGGVGILHKNTEDTITLLEEIMSKKTAAFKGVPNPDTGTTIYIPQERKTPQGGGRSTKIKPPAKGKGSMYDRSKEKRIVDAGEVSYKVEPARTKADLEGVMYLLHHIVCSLDRIADRLEHTGMIKEAHDLDTVTNALEAYEEHPTFLTTLEQTDPTLRPEDLKDEQKDENHDLTRRGERK